MELADRAVAASELEAARAHLVESAAITKLPGWTQAMEAVLQTLERTDGLVLYCSNTGSTTFTANEHTATCTLSGPANHECELSLVPDGSETPPGATFWF